MPWFCPVGHLLVRGAAVRPPAHSGRLARHQVGKLLGHGDVVAQNRQVRATGGPRRRWWEWTPSPFFPRHSKGHPRQVARNPCSGECRRWGCDEMDRLTFSVAPLGLTLMDKIAGRNKPLAAVLSAATGGRSLRRWPANQIGVEACR